MEITMIIAADKHGNTTYHVPGYHPFYDKGAAEHAIWLDNEIKEMKEHRIQRRGHDQLL